MLSGKSGWLLHGWDFSPSREGHSVGAPEWRLEFVPEGISSEADVLEQVVAERRQLPTCTGAPAPQSEGSGNSPEGCERREVPRLGATWLASCEGRDEGDCRGAGRAAHSAVFAVTRVEREQSEFAVQVLLYHHSISSIRLGGGRTYGGTPCAALDLANHRSIASPNSAQFLLTDRSVGWCGRGGGRLRFSADAPRNLLT
jgi:hypothetical protein